MSVTRLEVTHFGALSARSFSFSAGVTVVLGDNEAGKSSMALALRSALFGFDPPAAARHPYAQGQGPELHVAATVRGRGGERMVERRLDKTPWMRTWRGSEQPGEFVRGNHGLDSGPPHVSAALFDAVFFLGADDLRRFDDDPGPELDRLLLGDAAGPGVRAITEAVDLERAQLWRRDLRSKKTRAFELDGQLKELKEESRAARAVERGLMALEREAEERAARAKAAQRRADALERELARLALMERIASSVREGLTPDVDLNGIVDTPPAPGPILAELEDAEEALGEPQERLAQPAVAFDEQDQRLLRRAAEVQAVLREEAARQRLQQRLGEHRQSAPLASRLPRGGVLGLAAAMGGGGAWLVHAQPGGSAAAAALVAGLLPLGAIALDRALTVREGPAPRETAAALRDALESQATGWRRLCYELGIELAHTDAAPSVLRAALEGARERHSAWTRDAAERERAQAELVRAEARLARVGERFEALAETLRAAVPAERSLERAHSAVAGAVLSRERCAGALREIESNSLLRDIEDDVRLDLARREGVFDAAEPRRLELERSAALAEATRERETAARAQERLAMERPPRTASEIDSHIEALREERGQVLVAHDRLALLSAVLQEGERRHRAAHQSAILDEASELATVLTDGGVSGLDCPGSGTRLTIQRPNGGTAALAPPLSRGLREQLHVCLRLAAIEHLDPGGQGPPMVLDEALVHWDAGRRRRFYGLLRAQEGRRQVLILTCHPALAEEACGALDAPLLPL